MSRKHKFLVKGRGVTQKKTSAGPPKKCRSVREDDPSPKKTKALIQFSEAEIVKVPTAPSDQDVDTVCPSSAGSSLLSAARPPFFRVLFLSFPETRSLGFLKK